MIEELIARECAIQRSQDAWRDEVVYIPVILMEDEIIHTTEYPYCDDLDCPCKDDLDLYRTEVADPLCDGLLTIKEAIRTFEGKQV